MKVPQMPLELTKEEYERLKQFLEKPHNVPRPRTKKYQIKFKIKAGRNLK
ncbi:hypothetical protein [Methanosalsum natronophilum]|nr:hypothetical protein [Methanosalsum natronophilum]MCS3924102.1 hypothetical protein [Methanosalsum natronophilum]